MMDARKAHVGIWAVLTAVLLLSPGPSEPATPLWLPAFLRPIADKLAHAFLFFMLVWLMARATPKGAAERPIWRRRLIWTGLFIVALEFAQRWVPNRTVELLDVAAGLIGAFVAALWVASKYR